MTENMTDEERLAIKARDMDINRDIDRIKRDIAETAQRHGFDKLTFTVDWPIVDLDEFPSVNCEGTLFG
jgi:hypothetical protein